MYFKYIPDLHNVWIWLSITRSLSSLSSKKKYTFSSKLNNLSSKQLMRFSLCEWDTSVINNPYTLFIVLCDTATPVGSGKTPFIAVELLFLVHIIQLTYSIGRKPTHISAKSACSWRRQNCQALGCNTWYKSMGDLISHSPALIKQRVRY